MLILLPLGAHNGVVWFQVPIARHVLATGPNRLNVSKHVKEATVSTGYSPFAKTDVLYEIWPLPRLRGAQVTALTIFLSKFTL